MRVHHLKPAEGSRKKKIRAARGEGGRRGKTAGRGTKGQKARNTTRVGFEGGQTPLHRRLPKMRGFKNPFRVEFDIVNIERLEKEFKAGDEITPETLRAKGLIPKRKRPVKILGQGEISKAVTVKVDAASESAAEKIRAAGGTVETSIEAARQARDELRTKRRKQPRAKTAEAPGAD